MLGDGGEGTKQREKGSEKASTGGFHVRICLGQHYLEPKIGRHALATCFIFLYSKDTRCTCVCSIVIAIGRTSLKGIESIILVC